MLGLSRSELAVRLGVCQSTVYNWSKLPTFPPSQGFRRAANGGAGAEVWDLGAVRQWVQGRVVPPTRAIQTARRKQERLEGRAALRTEARRMRSDGAELHDIAAVLGVSYTTIRADVAGIPVK